MKKFSFSLLAFMLLASLCFGSSITKIDEKSITFKIEKINLKTQKIGQLQRKPLITCDNGLKGYMEFVEKDTIKYYYVNFLKKGINYTCKSSSEYLGVEEKFSFYSGDFLPVEFEFLPPNTVKIVMDDDMSKDEFLKNVKLEKVNKLAHTPLTYKIQNTNGRVFVLKTNEDAQKIKFYMQKGAKSLYGAKTKEDYEQTSTINVKQIQPNKYTKSLVFYDEPVFATKSEGKIVLRVFTKQDFYGNENIRKFIKIDGIKNFSVSDSDWVDLDMINQYGLDKDSWYYFDVIGDFKPNTFYKVSFLKGFGNANAQLSEDKDYRIKSGDFGQYVGFEDDKKPYISSFGDIALKSINVNKIQIVVSRMLEQNLRYFMNFDKNIAFDRVSKEIVNKEFD
ncbi:MAG: hypothetical protein KGV58_01525, partial [Campylobacteraceae bacterium]|nr:hypothetical protein [Campylobacteraceae bacterium]